MLVQDLKRAVHEQMPTNRTFQGKRAEPQILPKRCEPEIGPDTVIVIINKHNFNKHEHKREEDIPQ